MLTANKYIIAYDSHRITYPEQLLGGKAKNLFILYRKGFRVPEWIVVSSYLFESVMQPLTDKIDMIFDTINYDELATIDTASSKIHSLIKNIKISSEIIAQIKKTVQLKLNATDKFAVRSSVIGEDSPCNSFAGQMDSFLNVSYCNLIGAIKEFAPTR